MKYKTYIYLLILVVLNSCSYCDFMNNQSSKEYYGSVIDINNYKWDRGKKVITIKNVKGKFKYYFPTEYIYDDFWREIALGDSIYKPKNVKIFSVFRNGLLVNEMELDFNCSN